MGRKLPYPEFEGDMAKAQLQKIERYAVSLNDMIHPDDELEGWVQNKLARISTDIGDVKHYLEYQLKKMADGGMLEMPQIDEIKPHKVSFKFEQGEGEEEEEIVRIVTIYATSQAEANEIAEKKFSEYYDDFEIVTIEEDDDDDVMNHGGMMKVSPFQMVEAKNMVGAEKWSKMDSEERKELTSYLLAKGLLDTMEEEEDDDEQ